MISKYITHGHMSPDTLFHCVIKMGASPIAITLSGNAYLPEVHIEANDGVIDTLQYLLFNEEFRNRGSFSHTMSRLLTNNVSVSV